MSNLSSSAFKPEIGFIHYGNQICGGSLGMRTCPPDSSSLWNKEAILERAHPIGQTIHMQGCFQNSGSLISVKGRFYHRDSNHIISCSGSLEMGSKMKGHWKKQLPLLLIPSAMSSELYSCTIASVTTCRRTAH